MIANTNRRALRAALPWLFVGFLLLAASVGMWAAARALDQGHVGGFELAPAARVAGLLGAGIFLIGMLHLSRALIGARPSLAFVLALLFWSCELALRVHSLLSTPVAAADGSVAQPSNAFELAARLLCACAAMIALASGMLWIWGGRTPRAVRSSWRTTRALFVAQACAYVAVLLGAWLRADRADAAFETMRAAIPWNLGWPLVWLVFALPFASVFVALQRTVQHAARRESLMDMLNG